MLLFEISDDIISRFTPELIQNILKELLKYQEKELKDYHIKNDTLINPKELNLIIPFDKTMIDKECLNEINKTLLNILGMYLVHTSMFKHMFNHSLNIYLSGFSSIETNPFYQKVIVYQEKHNTLNIGTGK